MAARCLLSWSQGIHNLDAPRRAFKPGQRAAVTWTVVFAKLAADRARTTVALVVADSYDPRAIMTTAIAAARSRRAGIGEARGSACRMPSGRLAGRQGHPPRHGALTWLET